MEFRGNYRCNEGCAQKKSAEPRPLPQPRPRGTVEQHLASAPFGARLKVLLLLSRAEAQVGRFAGSSNLTLARRSNCQSALLFRPIVGVNCLQNFRCYGLLSRANHTPRAYPWQELRLRSKTTGMPRRFCDDCSKLFLGGIELLTRPLSAEIPST